jgi:hypothetical protein
MVLSQSNFVLVISSQSPSTAISRTRPTSYNNWLNWTLLQLNSLKFWQLTLPNWTLLHNHFARSTQKTAFLVKEVCLLIRCLAMDVLLRVFVSSGMCLPSCCLAADIHVTVLNRNIWAVKFWKLEVDIRTEWGGQLLSWESETQTRFRLSTMRSAAHDLENAAQLKVRFHSRVITRVNISRSFSRLRKSGKTASA